MTGLELAKTRIAAMIAARGAPRAVALTLYGGAEQYALHHPGEDYAEHLAQRAALVAWLGEHGIKIEDAAVTAREPTSTADLAEAAGRSKWRLEKGAPYRLGLSLAGATRDNPGAKLGWMTLLLGREEKGEDR